MIITLQPGADLDAVKRALVGYGQWVKAAAGDGQKQLVTEPWSAGVALADIQRIPGVAQVTAVVSERPRIDAQQLGLTKYYRLYKAKDGWLQVAAVDQKHRAAFDSFAGADAEAAFAKRSLDESLSILKEIGVPAEKSDDKASMGLFDNKTYKQRNWTAEYHHPYVGKLEQIGLTYELSATPGVLQRAPLVVGDCSAEILAELGYSEEQIDELAAEGAMSSTPPRKSQKAMKSPWQ